MIYEYTHGVSHINNYFLITGLNLHELYLDNLPKLEYIRPMAFTPLRNLKKIFISNNAILRSIDVEAFDKGQKLNEVSQELNYSKKSIIHTSL